jgi:predicted GNAT superfamily acetyltransferase
MNQPSESNHPQSLTPDRLGFQPVILMHGDTAPSAWKQTLGGRVVTFRLLQSVEELMVAEELQRDVFDLTDYDLVAASELVVVHETGGGVIAAFVDENGSETAVGCLFGWGGYVDGRPRIVSDFMAVRKEFRSAGIGAAMKRLQAAIALERGFEEIIWTVDPLRAANARLNFGKLGAHSNRYIENLYGVGYGETIYGRLPSDRIQVTWPIASASVQEHLLRNNQPPRFSDVAELEKFDAGKPDITRSLIFIPNDIDQIMASDQAAALKWRLRLRHELQAAFAAGLAITGLVPDADLQQGLAAYVLERRPR